MAVTRSKGKRQSRSLKFNEVEIKRNHDYAGYGGPMLEFNQQKQPVQIKTVKRLNSDDNPKIPIIHRPKAQSVKPMPASSNGQFQDNDPVQRLRELNSLMGNKPTTSSESIKQDGSNPKARPRLNVNLRPTNTESLDYQASTVKDQSAAPVFFYGSDTVTTVKQPANDTDNHNANSDDRSGYQVENVNTLNGELLKMMQAEQRMNESSVTRNKASAASTPAISPAVPEPPLPKTPNMQLPNNQWIQLNQGLLNELITGQTPNLVIRLCMGEIEINSIFVRNISNLSVQQLTNKIINALPASFEMLRRKMTLVNCAEDTLYVEIDCIPKLMR